MSSERVLPKTIVGNRIDPSLAQGIARSFLRTARLQSEKVKKSANTSRSYSNSKSRQRAFKAISKALESTKISVIAQNKDYLVGRFLAYLYYENSGREYLSVTSVDLDFRRETDCPDESWEDWPFKTINIFGYVSQHSLERIIQRTGCSTIEEMHEILKPVWLWSDVAVKLGDEAQKWLLPTEKGLFSLSSERDFLGCISTSVITYIDKADMSDSNKKTWAKLVEVGAIKLRPVSFAAESKLVTDAQMVCFWEMYAEGTLQIVKEDAKEKGVSLQNYINNLPSN